MLFHVSGILKMDYTWKPFPMSLMWMTAIVIVQGLITRVLASLVKEVAYFFKVPYYLFSLD